MSQLILTENSAAPVSVAANTLALYAKSDGKLYYQDDTLTEHELATGSGGGAVPHNLLINGQFAVWQRGETLSGLADDTYGPDRWCVLTQSAAIAAARQSGNTQHSCCRLTQSSATAQRFGLAQIIEGVNCQHLRGQTVSVGARVRCSSAGAVVRIAVLEWSGTEDSVTSDVVAAWAAVPTWATSVSSPSTAGSATCAAAGTWYDIAQAGVTLGSSFRNLVVLVWSEAPQAQNVTLDVEAAQLVAGASAGVFAPRSIGAELALCQRYYWRWVGSNSQHISAGLGFFSTTAWFECVVSYPRMRTTPTGAGASAASTFDIAAVGGVLNPTAVSFANLSPENARLAFAVSNSHTGQSALARADSSSTAYLWVDAEL